MTSCCRSPARPPPPPLCRSCSWTTSPTFSASSVSEVDRWTSPVLLIHGDDDRNVPFGESVDLAYHLARRGVYFEELVLVQKLGAPSGATVGDEVRIEADIQKLFLKNRLPGLKKYRKTC